MYCRVVPETSIVAIPPAGDVVALQPLLGTGAPPPEPAAPLVPAAPVEPADPVALPAVPPAPAAPPDPVAPVDEPQPSALAINKMADHLPGHRTKVDEIDI